MTCNVFGGTLNLTQSIINLPQSFLFVPIALKTLGAIAPCSLDFLTEVGQQLSAATGNVHETAFLFQCISVALQRCNAVLIHESFVIPEPFQHVLIACC